MEYGDLMATIGAVAGLLNGCFVFRPNAKFDRRAGRVDEHSGTLQALVRPR